jgi:TatD DNase family protein
MIDAHVHLADSRFTAVGEVLERAHRAGVEQLVMAGTEPADWERQIALAREHPSLFMSFGLHPWKATSRTGVMEALTRLRGVLDGPARPVAIGETGLDRSGPHGAHIEVQRLSLGAHLDLALERDLPVILHVVQAHGMMLDLLRARSVVPRGMVHAFDGSLEVARAYESLGLHLSIGGRVCAPEARRLHRSAAAIESERLLVETDAPDQTPYGVDGLNEPALLPHIVEHLAGLRNQSPDALAAQTAANARALFELGR